jgi:serine/threonine-protein phosphatase 4 regulatory subunit 4
LKCFLTQPRVVTDIAQHPSSYKRHLFIDICFMAVEMFSRAFFKEYFFEAALRLMTDKVPNIRLRLCPLLPIMKRMLKIPGDKSLQQWLETGCQKLMLSERDRDVRPATEQVTVVLTCTGEILHTALLTCTGEILHIALLTCTRNTRCVAGV